MTLWTISSNTVFFQITGMKSIEQMVRLHNQDIGIQLYYVEAIFIYLVV